MKLLHFVIAILIVCTSCKQKVLSGKELEDKLAKTMTDHLHKTLPKGTKVDIKETIYYADKIKNQYICTFTVAVHAPNKDTIGEMKALIPNDFSKVERIQ